MLLIFRMTSLIKAIFKNGRWENPVEFDTWKIPGKLEFLKLKFTEKDHSDIPQDPKVPMSEFRVTLLLIFECLQILKLLEVQICCL